jgi:hypothetical protein
MGVHREVYPWFMRSIIESTWSLTRLTECRHGSERLIRFHSLVRFYRECSDNYGGLWRFGGGVSTRWRPLTRMRMWFPYCLSRDTAHEFQLRSIEGLPPSRTTGVFYVPCSGK